MIIGSTGYLGGEQSYAGEYRLWAPLWYNQHGQLLFTDLRCFDRSGSSLEGNFQIGYRQHLTPYNVLFGVYGGYDQRRSVHRQQYQQLLFGGELWLERWFIGGNYYQPVGKKTHVLSQRLLK